MKDLTQGSIPKHLLQLASFIAISMLFQTLYYMVDLYFVAGLGPSATAGVSLSGNLAIAVLALTQMLGVGTSSLIAQAAGRKDRDSAQTVFNQSFVLSAIVGFLVLLLTYFLREPYLRALSTDPATVQQGSAYLRWFGPALALQFGLVSMGSALRGTGVAKPTMIVQIITVGLNCLLAPVFIAGWGTGHAYGVEGAGIATFISLIVGDLALVLYFFKLETYVTFEPAQFRPHFPIWKKLLNIGIPSGGEFILLSLHVAIIYWIIRDFGPAAQAGYGIGSRVMQAIFLPVMAISFAVAPLAGQNFGARSATRVRQTLKSAALIGTVVMASVTILCQISPASLIHFFTKDPAIVTSGGEYLRIIALNFVASGLVFTFSGMFQALGNTWPSLASSIARLFVFFIPAMIISRLPGFELRQLWYLNVFTGLAHASVAFFLLRREMDEKLQGLT